MIDKGERFRRETADAIARELDMERTKQSARSRFARFRASFAEFLSDFADEKDAKLLPDALTVPTMAFATGAAPVDEPMGRLGDTDIVALADVLEPEE